MIIYADPTELRQRSRLSQEVQDIARVLPGLEEKTGADLLVTPLEMPAGTDYLLTKHCQQGLLIQRKTGGDLPSSVQDGRLYKSLHKMKEWTPMPWLVVCAHVFGKESGQSVIDGRDSIQYSALIGALDWWSLRGGFYTILSGDQHLLWWLGQWPSRFKSLEHDKVIRKAHQSTVMGAGQVDTLCTFPGVGSDKAEALMEGRTLAEALVWLADLEMPGPAGVGQKTKEAAYKYLGLDGYKVLREDFPEPWDRVSSALLEMDRDDLMTETWPLLFAAVNDQRGTPCQSHETWQDWLQDEIKMRRENK